MLLCNEKRKISVSCVSPTLLCDEKTCTGCDLFTAGLDVLCTWNRCVVYLEEMCCGLKISYFVAHYVRFAFVKRTPINLDGKCFSTSL